MCHLRPTFCLPRQRARESALTLVVVVSRAALCTNAGFALFFSFSGGKLGLVVVFLSFSCSHTHTHTYTLLTTMDDAIVPNAMQHYPPSATPAEPLPPFLSQVCFSLPELRHFWPCMYGLTRALPCLDLISCKISKHDRDVCVSVSRSGRSSGFGMQIVVAIKARQWQADSR